MRFAVESWSPEYGVPLETDLDPTTTEVAVDIEVSAAAWAPVPARGVPVGCVRFVDGVRRVDARIWVLPPDGGVAVPAVAASYAAGVVGCEGDVARVESCTVRRGLFSSAADLGAVHTGSATYAAHHLEEHQAVDLVAAVQADMRHLEVEVALRAGDGPGPSDRADMVVVDGPLRAEHTLPTVVGYVKTHHTTYLPAELHAVVARLAPAQRTPVFRVGSGRRSRLSWYLRLPAGGRAGAGRQGGGGGGRGGGGGGRAHPWAGVVRCEVAGDRDAAWAVGIADRTAATLPRFASAPHTDARAPQNLHPIAGLERHLRHRLGDPLVLLRALGRAAAGPPEGGP